MGSIGLIVKSGIVLGSKVKLPKFNVYDAQLKVLTKLLKKAQFTDFGVHYHFADILLEHDKVKAFQERVPIHTYEKIFAEWWKTALTGEHNVTWPGKVENWALSSGTSSGSSKYIPVTKQMLKAIQRASITQIMAFGKCGLPQEFFEKGLLMLGGSTSLDYNGIHYAGDLSGITTGSLPFWFQPYYKPGKEISATRNWQEKLDKITKEAHQWDISGIAGNPAWFQILMEQIIEHNKVKNIHQVWPNLQVFTWGAVSFEPYRKKFESLLGKPLIYLETYLASEGFFAFQDRPEAKGMKMVVRNGIFYEFIQFDEKNFDDDGNLKDNPTVCTFNDIQENIEYAIVISTVAGSWRYLLGDVIKFVDAKRREIKITGRTKHYLSLCGEHLSVDNINKAIELTSNELNLPIREFALAGVPYNDKFAHRWFVATDSVNNISSEVFSRVIDKNLSILNDDYRIERGYGVKEVFVEFLPHEIFLKWIKEYGKEGAQSKFPKVLKGKQLETWLTLLDKEQVKQ